jgi:arylsulfatase A-like enzyme
MKRVWTLQALLICWISGIPACRQSSSGSTGGVANRPNLLMIVADDLGWANVGFHGGSTATPHLDRLARDGLELRRCYLSPLCSPARAALLTGQDPIRYGLQGRVIRPWHEDGLPAEAITLAEILQVQGYQTALIGKWHLGHARPELRPGQQGFEHFYGYLGGAVDHFDHRREGGLDWQRNGESLEEDGYATFLCAEEAVQFLRQRDRERPFFLMLSLPAVHKPLQAPPDLMEKYAPLELDHLVGYSAMVDALDQAVGRVDQVLAEEGLTSQTLVTFLSDDGAGPLGGDNKPFRGHKGTPLEGGIRVIAVMRWPGQLPAGKATQQVVRDFDFLPTFLGALQCPPAASFDLDGLDLWRVLREGREVDREPLVFAGSDPGSYAVLQQSWKLVSAPRLPQLGSSPALFDLSTEPHEKTDRSQHQPQRVQALLQAHQQWWQRRPPTEVAVTDGRPPDWQAPADWN